jgi:dTDP-4-dehydrorhamnose 3,5-epimerase
VKDLPADDEGGILWPDPDIAIDRPVKDPIISDRDKRHPHLSDLPDDRLPVTSF